MSWINKIMKMKKNITDLFQYQTYYIVSGLRPFSKYITAQTTVSITSKSFFITKKTRQITNTKLTPTLIGSYYFILSRSLTFLNTHLIKKKALTISKLKT